MWWREQSCLCPSPAYWGSAKASCQGQWLSRACSQQLLNDGLQAATPGLSIPRSGVTNEPLWLQSCYSPLEMHVHSSVSSLHTSALLQCYKAMQQGAAASGLPPSSFSSLFACLTDTEESRWAPSPDKGSLEQVDRDVLLSSVFKSKHRASLWVFSVPRHEVSLSGITLNQQKW